MVLWEELRRRPLQTFFSLHFARFATKITGVPNLTSLRKPVMEMVLLDWTRMGIFYCLAGAVSDGGQWKFVRPLLKKHRTAAMRNMGWPRFLLKGHSRWEIFELKKPESAAPEPPHVEDTWIAGMHSKRKIAAPSQRRAILQAGLSEEGEPLFGQYLTGTRTAAFLKPGTGSRSLATLLVDAERIRFQSFCGKETAIPDIRVTFDLPGLKNRLLPIKDHWLLLRAEEAGLQLSDQLQALAALLQQMGPTVAVRLGLSRSFNPTYKEKHKSGLCWLMADGFFSFDDPQP